MTSSLVFANLADRILVSHLARDPVSATYLGDHRHDGELPDPSLAAAESRAAELRAQLAELDAIELSSPADEVDAAILRTALCAEQFTLEESREAEWNPMVHNPGNALHALLSRDFAPLPQRLTALAARLSAVPDYLAAARTRLADSELSRIHLDTAVSQLAGTLGLLDDSVPAALAEQPALRATVEPPASAARDAVAQFRDWLAGRADSARRDPRRGGAQFAAQLALALDTAFEPGRLLERAEQDLAEIADRITAEAGRLAGAAQPDAGTVRAVLDRLAADAPTDATILPLCRDALSATTAFVRAQDLVTVYDDVISVVEMPEIDRGVAVAYCRPPGPLEATPPPTEFAVSPTPKEWTTEQVGSFYREYNAHMIHNLAVHEAMPGHALQLAHSNRYRAATPVRAVWWSGSFVEGWAVYAEALMADRGYRADVSDQAAAALRMQQLKMQLRTILNTIMDVRFHHGDLDEAEAMALMRGRGFQEQGEALGKWRRVQLTATQLSTYYVGYCEVRDLVAELRATHPRWSDRRLHDTVLGVGSPPVRHLRTLLGAG